MEKNTIVRTNYKQFLPGLVVMVMMALMDMVNNFVNPALFILLLCIINIILWRLVNQTRESIRINNANKDIEEQQEDSTESISAATDKTTIIECF